MERRLVNVEDGGYEECWTPWTLENCEGQTIECVGQEFSRRQILSSIDFEEGSEKQKQLAVSCLGGHCEPFAHF